MNTDTAVLRISAASTVGYSLPATTTNRYKEKSKTKQSQKQIQKRNLNGERGGTSPTPTEAHAMLSSTHKTIRSEIEELPLVTESRRQDQP